MQRYASYSFYINIGVVLTTQTLCTILLGSHPAILFSSNCYCFPFFYPFLFTSPLFFLYFTHFFPSTSKRLSSFYKVIRERACWRQVGGPRKNGDFNAFLLGAVTMALICRNCGNEKGNLAAYSSSCHPSSKYLNGMETTLLQNLTYSCSTKTMSQLPPGTRA